jgi:hypothetical protein
MNSRDIYQTLVRALARDLEKQGYQRVKGTFPSWTKLRNGKFATVWFQAARRGGEFTIEFQYSLKPEPGTAKWNERQRLFELLHDAERRDVSRKFPMGAMTANNDYWFLARDRDSVVAVAEWLKTRLDALMARIVA